MENEKLIYQLVKAFGTSFLIVGLVLLIGVYFIASNGRLIDVISILLTLSFGFFSFGFALLSIGIAKEADIKMIRNANEYFLGVIDIFEDKRIRYLNDLRRNIFDDTEYIAWKSTEYVKRATKLNKYKEIEEESRESFFNVFLELVHQFPWLGQKYHFKDKEIVVNINVLTLVDVQNLFRCYRDIIDSLYDKRKDEVMLYFSPFVDDWKKSSKSVDDAIKEYINEIKETRKILKEVIGKQRRYPFMRLNEARELKEQKREN